MRKKIVFVISVLFIFLIAILSVFLYKANLRTTGPIRFDESKGVDFKGMSSFKFVEDGNRVRTSLTGTVVCRIGRYLCIKGGPYFDLIFITSKTVISIHPKDLKVEGQSELDSLPVIPWGDVRTGNRVSFFYGFNGDLDNLIVYE